MRIYLSDLPLGQVYEYDLFTIHERIKFKGAHVLAHDVAHERVVDKGAEFGHEVIEHLAFVKVGCVHHLLRPEIDHERVGQMGPLFFLEFTIDEKPRDLEYATAFGARHDRLRGVAQPVFELRSDNTGFFWVE